MGPVCAWSQSDCPPGQERPFDERFAGASGGSGLPLSPSRLSARGWRRGVVAGASGHPPAVLECLRRGEGFIASGLPRVRNSVHVPRLAHAAPAPPQRGSTPSQGGPSVPNRRDLRLPVAGSCGSYPTSDWWHRVHLVEANLRPPTDFTGGSSTVNVLVFKVGP